LKIWAGPARLQIPATLGYISVMGNQFPLSLAASVLLLSLPGRPLAGLLLRPAR